MKDREQVTTNGRAVFYASMWEDLKSAALNCGWALGLHGSLNSDMDIMAMPWTEDASPVEMLMDKLCECFTGGKDLRKEVQIYFDKPGDRVVYTIPIWFDFYLDINILQKKPGSEKTGLDFIAEERQRQIEVEGWSIEHDAVHTNGELASAASAYAHQIYFMDSKVPMQWPFEKEWWKPTPEDKIKQLAKAGALIAAEIDRLINSK